MLDQNLPIVLIYILTIAAREQETTEILIDNIQTQQQRQKTESSDIIGARNAAQQQREKLAYTDKDPKALANIDRTGEPRKDDSDSNSCLKIILAVLIFVISIWSFGIGGFILGVALVASVCTIVTQIAQAAIQSHARMRQFEIVMGWINPVQLYTDAIVTAVCELGGYNPNDEKIQRLRMALQIAFSILATVAIIVAGIAAIVFTAGAATPAIVMAVVGMITGIIQLACAVLEYQKAEKELELAEKRFVLNKILAIIELIKMNLELVGQDIDLLIEMFTSNMSNIREEYEKASRILKEYNDTKRAIAQNIRS
jgi:hypothetical protein